MAPSPRSAAGRARPARRDLRRAQGALFHDRADSAVIEAPVVEIRAPVAGRFISALESGERVFDGTLLGTVQALDGTIVTLESPCDCLVLEQVALSGQHYQVGDDLIALIGAEQPLDGTRPAAARAGRAPRGRRPRRDPLSGTRRAPLWTGRADRLSTQPGGSARLTPSSPCRVASPRWSCGRTGRSSSRTSVFWSRCASFSLGRRASTALNRAGSAWSGRGLDFVSAGPLASAGVRP